jgi:hypothetical protein
LFLSLSENSNAEMIMSWSSSSGEGGRKADMVSDQWHQW